MWTGIIRDYVYKIFNLNELNRNYEFFEWFFHALSCHIINKILHSFEISIFRLWTIWIKDLRTKNVVYITRWKKYDKKESNKHERNT